MRLQATLALVNLALVLAGPTGISNPLSVSLSSVHGQTVDSIDDLVIISKITNTASNAVKVVQYGGILDGSSTQSFIVKKAGEEVKFAGVLPRLAMSSEADEFYRTIQPGETVTIEHKVAALYDFSHAGTGDFTFNPLVRWIDATTGSRKETELASLAVQVTKDVADRTLVPVVKRATNSCTVPEKKQFIDASYAESISDAQMLEDLLVKTVGPYTSKYIRHIATLATNGLLRKIPLGKILHGVTGLVKKPRAKLHCSDPLNQCADGQTIAYTVIRDSNTYFCDRFYNQVATEELCKSTTVHARNIRGGTILHEMIRAGSVANGAPLSDWVVDVAYGCPFDQGLSAYEQAHNADNYNPVCFATDVYKALKCPEQLM